MIVVSNTSPITNLAAIGELELLNRLYGEIVIPEGVWDELHSMGVSWPGAPEVDSASWVSRRSVQNGLLVDVLSLELDRGEAETIALALELAADLVLLDEREGRRTARRLGLSVIGVLGVLLDAKQSGHLLTIGPSVDALRKSAGFYLSDTLVQSVLELAGE